MDTHTDAEVINLIQLIRADPHRLSEFQQNRWRAEYAWFFERYPKLAQMSIDAHEFDLNIVRFMLDQKHAVDEDVATQHEASVAVGQRLASKYVYPKLRS